MVTTEESNNGGVGSASALPNGTFLFKVNPGVTGLLGHAAAKNGLNQYVLHELLHVAAVGQTINAWANDKYNNGNWAHGNMGWDLNESLAHRGADAIGTYICRDVMLSPPPFTPPVNGYEIYE